MLFTFLLVVQAIVAVALVAVILMQRSEGGGLGTGGSPAGLMSARGAADFLTRSTTVLATIFVSLSIALAVLAATNHRTTNVDEAAASKVAPTSSSTDPLAPAAGAVDPLGSAAATASGNAAVPAPASNGAVPLAR
jgi:preprotein translocase subunit SecG